MSPAELVVWAAIAVAFAWFAWAFAVTVLVRQWVVVRRVNVSPFAGGGAWHEPTDGTS